MNDTYGEAGTGEIKNQVKKGASELHSGPVGGGSGNLFMTVTQIELVMFSVQTWHIPCLFDFNQA